MNFREWGAKHSIPFHAILELENEVSGMLGTFGVIADGHTEAYAQSAVRLDAARRGLSLFRNNSGALKDETGRLVRYGLANDSKQLNERIKSSDLIGIDARPILACEVGRPRGRFVARECKPPGWTYGGEPREVAQLAFINLINAKGGDAKFATGEGSFDE